MFKAHGNGYALLDGQIVRPTDPPIHELKLQRVGTLRGKVTRDGKPAAGVTVAASSLLHQTMRESTTKTAKDGTYTLDEVTEGDCTLAVKPDDSIKGLVANSITKLRVSPGSEIDGLNLRLHLGIPLKVLVTTKEDGKPVAGRPVSFTVDGTQLGDITTDSEGIATLAIPEGDIYVNLRDEGPRQALSNYFVSGHITEEDHPLVRITVPKALILPPLKSLTGAVVGADGQPVSGATVTFLGQAGPAPTKTGADGTFRFTGPILPGDHIVAFLGDRISSKAPEVDEEQVAPIALDAKASDISGRIVDETGKPMAGLSVALGGQIAKQYIGFPHQKTDSNGVYRFPDLPGVVDEMYLWVNHPGYGDASIQPIKLAVGESKNLGTLTMQPTDGVITGKVEDDNAKPVAGITVNPQVMGLDVQTASDGTFKLTKIPRGKHWIVAGDDAHGQKVVELATGDSNVIIYLPRPTPRKQTGYVSASDMTSIAAPELKVGKWVVGQPVTLAGLKGKVVLLDFWATTCGPCVAAFPSMEKFYRQFKDKGVVMIGVCAPDTDARVLERLRQGGVTYLNTIDKPDKYGEPTSAKLYGYKGTPHLIVVDQNGKIISDGDDETDAYAAIKKALEKPSSNP